MSRLAYLIACDIMRAQDAALRDLGACLDIYYKPKPDEGKALTGILRAITGNVGAPSRLTTQAPAPAAALTVAGARRGRR